MAKNDSKVTDNPKLKQKELSDGNFSLYLDYYLGYIYDKESGRKKVSRKREFLKLTLFANPRTPLERQQNKETLELARQIRQEREQEFKSDKLGYRFKAKDMNLLDFMDSFLENTTKDVRMIKAAINRFKDFLSENYPIYASCISPNQANKEMMEHFVEYLKAHGKGEGPASYWRRFKKVIKAATDKGIFKNSPCDSILLKCDKNSLKKEILSLEEMEQLLRTTYPEQNQEVRKAFIFTLYTGIRFCDLKELTYSNIDFSLKQLSFNQNKVQGYSSSSFVYTPLNDALLSLIADPSKHEPEDKIFALPSMTMCQKTLRTWTKRANIKKHITWHCGRHSFAVNILNNGANIKTVSSLMGHSSIAMTEKYLHVVDKLKEQAVNSLPTFKI